LVVCGSTSAKVSQKLVLDVRSNLVLTERTDSRPAGDVLVHVQRDSGVALHCQIEASIRNGIRAGRLARGTALPPTRLLARDLGVSRGVVVEAYQQLVAEGYLTSQAGGYTRVAVDRETTRTPAPAAPTSTARIDFCPCRADGSQFPRRAWLRSVRRVLTEASPDDFGYVNGRGAPALHHALAVYLNRVRGTSARPENIVICNGYAQGVGLIIHALVKAGAKRLAVEDPSADDDAVPVARAAGLEVVGVPVGENGIRVESLERTDADALVLTPSHQWPTGAVLPATPRAALEGPRRGGRCGDRRLSRRPSAAARPRIRVRPRHRRAISCCQPLTRTWNALHSLGQYSPVDSS
jgi:GntR family transcriptional regulator/MocR family aminotransferase